MPLGLAKSILTTAAPAAAATGFRAFTTSGEPDSGNMASYKWTGTDFTTNNEISVVMWFRANGTGFLDGTTSYFITLNHNSVSPKWLRVRFTTGSFGWQMQMLDSDNAYVDGRGYGNPTAQASDSFDGSWKCFMCYLKSNESATDSTTHRAMYINDTDYANLPVGFGYGTWNAGNFDAGQLRYSPYKSAGDVSYQDDTTQDDVDHETGSGFEMGPIWIYNSKVDFRNSSVRQRYYNSSNTDGFVAPATDGTTTAGATQPEIFLYHNGTTLVNGGSDTISIAETSIGTGSITVIPPSEGPGSGDTI